MATSTFFNFYIKSVVLFNLIHFGIPFIDYRTITLQVTCPHEVYREYFSHQVTKFAVIIINITIKRKKKKKEKEKEKGKNTYNWFHASLVDKMSTKQANSISGANLVCPATKKLHETLENRPILVNSPHNKLIRSLFLFIAI